MLTPPKLECFRIGPVSVKLVPSSPSREWMDAFTDRHAYRCLPLTIANTHGWDVLCPFTVTAHWNGGLTVEDITIEAEKEEDKPLIGHVLRSNFSRGIITFHTGFLFRTSPGWNLMATGTFNRPKPKAFAMTGIIETDWLPYPFTMNWQLMSPGTVTFEKDEPICTVMPIPKNYLQDVTPEIYNLNDDLVLDYEQDMFRRERDAFMKKFHARDPETIKQGWQRHYFVGRMPDHTKIEGHTNKLRLNEPINKAGRKPQLALAEPRGKMAQMSWEDYKKAHAPKLAAVPSLKDGVLTPGVNTIFLNSEDYASLDFVVRENFLTPEECRLLHETFAANRDLIKQDVNNDYWNGRIIFAHDLLQKSPEAAELLKTASQRTVKALADFYAFKKTLYADTVQLVHWPEGKFMPPHADNCEPDGKPNDVPWRDYGAVIYVNDDYEGGELYFTKLDMVLRPKAGMLAAFPATLSHEHAVLKVAKGERVTLPAFYTFDKSHADKYIHAEQ